MELGWNHLDLARNFSGRVCMSGVFLGGSGGRRSMADITLHGKDLGKRLVGMARWFGTGRCPAGEIVGAYCGWKFPHQGAYTRERYETKAASVGNC